MSDQLTKELADVNEKIAKLEAVRDLFLVEQIEAKLAPLQQQKKTLEAQLAAMPNVSYRAEVKGSGAVAQGPGAAALGRGAVNVGGGKVEGSIITGKVEAGGDFVGRDKTTTTYGSGGADEATKAELSQLIQQLEAALQQIPLAHQAEAKDVAEQAELLVKEVARSEPAPAMVEITGERLQKAADNIKAVMPTVAVIVGQIMTAVSHYLPT